MASSTSNFIVGVKTVDGNPSNPSFSFLNDSSTGIYRKTDNQGNNGMGVSIDGVNIMNLYRGRVEILNLVKLPFGDVSAGSVLVCSSDGYGYWKKSNIDSGSVQISELYSTTNLINNSIPVQFNNTFASPPIVVCSKENNTSDCLNFSIKNRTGTGCELYPSLKILNTIVNADIGYVNTCKLVNNTIGCCYYNIIDDRMYFIASIDTEAIKWFDPVMIDDVSAVSIADIMLVDGYPAIVYIYDNDTEDEIRYVRATNLIGSTWDIPITLDTSTSSLNLTAESLFLRIVNGKPSVFYNNQAGSARIIRSNDATGTSWVSPAQISNLSNHQILDVQIISNNPAIIAKSNSVNNMYYVRSNNVSGSSWPVGAIQLYISPSISFLANRGNANHCMFVENDVIYIVSSQLNTNELYICNSLDSTGATWDFYYPLTTTNTTSAFPRMFKVEDVLYLVYNYASGTPSSKKVIRFDSIVQNSFTELGSIMNLNLHGAHSVILDGDDHIIIFAISDGKLSTLRYFSEGSVSWISHLPY